MAAARRRREAHGDAPASTADVRLGESPSHKPSRDRRGREMVVETRDTDKPSAKKRQAAKRVRVYVLTYFFSSLTIDRWRGLFGLVPVGWIFSSLAEWLGVPICHTNVQIQSVADPTEVAEFGFEGGPRQVTGVYQCAPGMNPHLAFTRQQKVYLGETELTHGELVDALREVEDEWQAPTYNLLSRNCNHFCDSLVNKLLPGRKIPSYINRGARLANWFPLPGFLPWYVKHYVKDGGSWTGGEVTTMALRERKIMGVSNFAEWKEWAKEGSESVGGGGKEMGNGSGRDGGEGVCGSASFETDPLAAHLDPVQML